MFRQNYKVVRRRTERFAVDSDFQFFQNMTVWSFHIDLVCKDSDWQTAESFLDKLNLKWEIATLVKSIPAMMVNERIIMEQKQFG